MWYSNIELDDKSVYIEEKNDKWESLNTWKNIKFINIFDHVYHKFQMDFMKKYDNSLLDRFMNYVSISTNSDSSSKKNPSTIGQIYFAGKIYNELLEMGIEAKFDKEYCYVYAKIEGDKSIPSIGFISHMDTSEDAKSDKINPLIINNYKGEDITYNGKSILTVKENPILTQYVGKTLITTDGNTLLGADDKSGIVEIMEMLEFYKKTNEPHGDIYVAFTPDEEVGKSVDYLNRNIFNPKYAYTVDGEYVGEISYENFNAADVNIKIKGTSVHPGYAKDKMVNANLIANAINSLLPKEEIPANTEGYEGFYHLHRMTSTVSEANMFYLIRDFDEVNFYNRIEFLKNVVKKLNDKFGNCIEIDVDICYRNMKKVIEKNIEIIDVVQCAIKKEGIEPYVKPIRGGTDGTRLSFEGIPCPNLGAGGHNFHSNQEYVCLEDMEKIRDILIGIVREYYLTYKIEKEESKSKVYKNN